MLPKEKLQTMHPKLVSATDQMGCYAKTGERECGVCSVSTLTDLLRDSREIPASLLYKRIDYR